VDGCSGSTGPELAEERHRYLACNIIDAAPCRDGLCVRKEGEQGAIQLTLFGIYTFGPDVLNAFGLQAGRQALLGNALLSVVFTIGCTLALIGINKIGRRPLLIWGFVAMTLGMLILGVFPHASLPVIILGFVIYALASGIPNDLLWIYPNELFPTEIRATSVGIATAISRVGDFFGTFAMPTMLVSLGIGPTMLVMTAVTFLGLVLAIALAPETKDLSLAEAAGINSK
jgi:putative MFS transporter